MALPHKRQPSDTNRGSFISQTSHALKLIPTIPEEPGTTTRKHTVLNEGDKTNRNMTKGLNTPSIIIDEHEKHAKLAVHKPTFTDLATDRISQRRIRLDIVGPNNVHLYQFMGYILDKAGEFQKIYEEKCKVVKEINDKKREEYQKKLKEMKETGDYTKKLEMPPDEDMPNKVFEEMFEEYLHGREMSLADPFEFNLFGRDFVMQYKLFDHVGPDRIKSLPDAVVFLVDGKEEEFNKQFMDSEELKQGFFMHLFFGTQNVFLFPYFSYRDRLMRHLDYQRPNVRKIEENMKKIFAFISKLQVIARGKILWRLQPSKDYGLLHKNETRSTNEHQRHSHQPSKCDASFK